MIPAVTATVVFAAGYLGIAAEHAVRVNKAATALVTGGLLWVIVALANPHAVEYALLETGADIFNITVFLLAAMSLVEILIHYRLFDALRARLLSYGLSTVQLFFALSGITFLLSSVIDNLTATIIAIQIARKFFWGRNLLVAAVAIVIAANAGGAFSPIGDVTTIMLWIAGKFTALEIITMGFVPSVVMFAVAVGMLSRKINDREEPDSSIQHEAVPDTEPLSRSERLIITAALASFLLPVLAKLIHLPPVLGILFGLGVTWVLVETLRQVSGRRSHLTATIEHLMQKTDVASIKFFVGILLAVSALHTIGVLDTLSNVLYGADQAADRVVVGNILLGLISPFLDNIPLTAIAISILGTTDASQWVLLALSVGTGGSLLAIGSAAGVVAMGLLKKLTFAEYFRIGFVPALFSFVSGIAVFLAQTTLLG